MTAPDPWGFDFETEIVPKGQIPRPVCYSVDTGDGQWILHRQDPDFKPGIVKCLEHRGGISTMPFDLEVIVGNFPDLTELVHRALCEDRVHDPLTTEKLVDIADGRYRMRGEYNLKGVADRRSGLALIKDEEDSPRGEYMSMWTTPVSRWPEKFRMYSIQDCKAHRKVALDQLASGYPIEDRFRQSRAGYTLKRTSTHGLGIDPVQLAKKRRDLERQLEELRVTMKQWDWVYQKKVKGDWKWSKREKLIREWVLDNLPERVIQWTDGGKSGQPKVSLSKEAVPLYAALHQQMLGDPQENPTPFAHYSEYVTADHTLSRVIGGFEACGDEVHTRFDELVSTGRASSSKPAIMNLHRKGGYREIMVARPGKTLVALDYGAQELVTFSNGAIERFGWSKMGDVLRRGRDPHLWAALTTLAMDYKTALAGKDAEDPWVLSMRQLFKVFNFGALGGMGEVTFSGYAASSYGVHIPQGEYPALKAAWIDAYPEIALHFADISAMGDGCDIWLPRSQRLHGDKSYCQACNLQFQGPAADMSKDAGYHILLEQELNPKSILYGTKLVLFAHDEWVIECPERNGKDVAEAAKQIMLEAGERWCPHVPSTVNYKIVKSYTK